MIGSTATADKNRLDTGTLGFSDIENRADFEVEHQSVGMSTGGSIGSQFAGNMANGLLVGANRDGHDSSTTHAAVSDGTLIVRDRDRQVQDVNQLSRDVAHANQTLSPIFDKEKEQERLQQAQLIGEIGNQVADIARTEGSIRATNAAKEKLKNVNAQDLQEAKAAWEKANPGKTATLSDINGQIYQTAYNDAMNASGFGTGGQYQQAIQAATAAVQGLAGSDLSAALAGGAAPYVAEVIGHYSDLNDAGKVAAHAVVNAALAAAQNQNALAGAAGAATGELVGMIATEMYGKPADELDETQKQTVSALATLAAGLSGGLAGDSSASAVAGAQAGKTTVENNSLGDIAAALAQGKTTEQVAEEQVKAENERYKRENCGGMSAEACAVKMYTERREALKDMALFGVDFVPVVGDIKSFAEAHSALDYLAATIGIIPGAGDVAGKAIKGAEKALKAGDLEAASKLINQASDEIYAVSGAKWNWNKELNKPLPNKTYNLDGDKVYKTDHLARPQQVEATLSANVKDRNGYQQCKAGKCGNPGDEGGHLIASIFNGPGEKLNLVPMDGNLNKGAWKQMENTWAKAVSEGKEVKVNIQPTYVGDSVRPDKFYIEYTIDGGRPIAETFKNAPGGK